MATGTASARPLHPTVRAFADKHGIAGAAVRSDGRLTLTLDKKYRVHLQGAPHNRLALTAQLLSLPAATGDQKAAAALERLMKTAAGLMREHAATLCLDARQQALLLQQQLPASTDVAALEKGIAAFTNALAFWSKLGAAEAAAL
ncbi:MAG TPA: CesT family type III secretion system chaperone [Ramlibacter sp.]|nr:CesT family type III secretion system chaperone [Ramlibacter sp.]